MPVRQRVSGRDRVAITEPKFRGDPTKELVPLGEVIGVFARVGSGSVKHVAPPPPRLSDVSKSGMDLGLELIERSAVVSSLG